MWCLCEQPSPRVSDEERTRPQSLAASLRQEALGLLIAEQDLVDGVSSVLERDVLAVDVGREKDFWVPSKALAGGEVGDQTRGALGVTNVNHRRLLLGYSGAQQTGASAMQAVAFGRGRWRRRGRRRAGVRAPRRARSTLAIVGSRLGSRRDGDGGRHGENRHEREVLSVQKCHDEADDSGDDVESPR
jgi:hypothetical protein